MLPIHPVALLPRRDLVPNEPDHKLSPTTGGVETYLCRISSL